LAVKGDHFGTGVRHARHRWIILAITVASLLPSFACSADGPADPGSGAPNEGLRLEPVASGLSAPVDLAAPTGDDRLFIVEQAGRIRVIEDGSLRAIPFLDIRERVRSGGERGLLGLAFPGDFPSAGYFFVHYSDLAGDTRVSRFRVGSDPSVADADSEAIFLRIAQPFANHNGGRIAFGTDGMLYVGLGDGGSGGDPLESGQDLGTLLGSILRLDVRDGPPYGIPPDNPFVAVPDARDEIWAYGLRNPWKFSFDGPDGMLYIADVGQSRWEEVNAMPANVAGVNYGWNLREGPECFSGANCVGEGLADPVLAYDHDRGCSITGGFVYRGSQIPELIGTYLYADYCGGWIRGFRLVGGVATDDRALSLPTVPEATSFGQDGAGELYILSGRGDVYRIAPGG
jgi:glucose/arabinose dehydrogenase